MKRLFFGQKNTSIVFRLVIICSCVLLLCGNTSLWAQAFEAASGNLKTFVNPRKSFEIHYPETLEAVTQTSPNNPLPQGAELLLRSKRSDSETNSSPLAFPTFNIISRAGPYRFLTPNESRDAEELLQSYRDVGILEPQLLSSRYHTVSERQAFQAELKYQLNNQNLVSLVTIVSSPYEHFILTFIDEAADYPKSNGLREILINNFKILSRDKNPESPVVKSRSWFSVLAILFLTATIFALLIARQRN